jgi:hypothetical protein
VCDGVLAGERGPAIPAKPIDGRIVGTGVLDNGSRAARRNPRKSSYRPCRSRILNNASAHL